MRDVGAGGELGFDGVEEGGVGGGGGRAPEHGDELEVWRGGVDGAGGGAVVVVPGQVRGGGVPELVVRRVVFGDVDETAFRGAGAVGGGEEGEEGEEEGEEVHGFGGVRRWWL